MKAKLASSRAEARRTGRGLKGGTSFTLIELLMVLALIVILAAMLLPTLSRAKQKAARSACLNRLHELGCSLKMYADDDSSRYPTYAWADTPDGFPANHNSRWWSLLEPYSVLRWTNADYHCPAYKGTISETNDFGNPFSLAYGSYSYNCAFELGLSGLPESKVAAPSQCIAITDSKSGFISGRYTRPFRGYDWNMWIGLGGLAARSGYQQPPQHGNTFNVLYCDGGASASRIPDLCVLSISAPIWFYDHQPHKETWPP